jgi:hypothetical protein
MEPKHRQKGNQLNDKELNDIRSIFREDLGQVFRALTKQEMRWVNRRKSVRDRRQKDRRDAIHHAKSGEYLRFGNKRSTLRNRANRDRRQRSGFDGADLVIPPVNIQ